MSRARVIITAVVVEGRSQAEVARDYGVSPGWVSKLVARYRAEGDAAFKPRSRRPHNQPLRVNGQMHHIGLSRTLDGTRVLTLINGYDIRIIDATTGEILRTLTINPERRYHGTGQPPGAPKGPRKPKDPNPQ